MQKIYINHKSNAQIICLSKENKLPNLNPEGSFLKFIWNRGPSHADLAIDGQKIILLENQVICYTYLQKISVENNHEQITSILFNREFYCVHTNDREVSCNGLLFFGSNQIPLLQLNEPEISRLEYLVFVLLEEFDTDDGNREEMLRILLKRFIIKCTRLAKRQLLKGSFLSNEIDTIRMFNVLVEEHFKSLKKVNDYARLMHKSPKTIANIFNKHTNISPLEVIHKRIIIEAERLFNFTNKSAKETGQELGFEDAAQFSKFFKTMTGKSITEYKNQQ